MGNQELSAVGSTLHGGKESTTTIAFSHSLISQSSSYFLLVRFQITYSFAVGE